MVMNTAWVEECSVFSSSLGKTMISTVYLPGIISSIFAQVCFTLSAEELQGEIKTNYITATLKFLNVARRLSTQLKDHLQKTLLTKFKKNLPLVFILKNYNFQRWIYSDTMIITYQGTKKSRKQDVKILNPRNSYYQIFFVEYHALNTCLKYLSTYLSQHNIFIIKLSEHLNLCPTFLKPQARINDPGDFIPLYYVSTIVLH